MVQYSWPLNHIHHKHAGQKLNLILYKSSKQFAAIIIIIIIVIRCATRCITTKCTPNFLVLFDSSIKKNLYKLIYYQYLIYNKYQTPWEGHYIKNAIFYVICFQVTTRSNILKCRNLAYKNHPPPTSSIDKKKNGWELHEERSNCAEVKKTTACIGQPLESR